MSATTEIRWHARAGQGAKTAAQLYAEAALRGGRSVQAFPEYGPERRGAPVRAYTRVSDEPIRRHDAIVDPDVVVVLEPSLADDPSVLDGLDEEALLLVNADEAPDTEARVVKVPASRIAADTGARFANVVMLGAVAAAIGEPPLETIEAEACAQLGAKASPDAVRAAVREGYRCLS